jgi:hypothetical protein
MRIIVIGIIFVFALVVAYPVVGQTARMPDPSEKKEQPATQIEAAANDNNNIIQQLNNRLETLEARIKELEATQALEALQANAHISPAAIAVTEEVAEQPPQKTTADGLPLESPTLQIKGFADVQYHASDLKSEKNAFALGQLDLFITSRLSEKINVLAELVVEAAQDNQVGLDLERLVLQYSVNNHLNLNFGRYHTAIGFHNTAYHHGAWFQTAIDRPFIFAFEDEGGILPIHNIGVSANGRIPSGRLGLQYIAEIGNGRTSRSSLDEPVQNIVDENNGKAVNLGLIARPEWMRGLQAGVSIYRDRLAPEGLPKVGQTIIAAHVVYLGHTFELLNEAVLVRHSTSGTQGTFNTTGFYTQVARKFGNLQPYLRYQYINAPRSEPIFKDLGRSNGPSAGLRYDFSEFAAFKVQYDRTARRGLNVINKIGMQLAFTF